MAARRGRGSRALVALLAFAASRRLLEGSATFALAASWQPRYLRPLPAPSCRLTALASQSGSWDPCALEVGGKVRARLAEGQQWHLGRLSARNDDGTWVVAWDEPRGGKDTHSIEPDCVRRVYFYTDYQVGDECKALAPGSGKWCAATVVEDLGGSDFRVRLQEAAGGDETVDLNVESMKKAHFRGSATIPFSSLELGQKYTGVVTSVAEFGAFVDIGAEANGLLHVSKMLPPPLRVVHVRNHVQEDQEVTVWISGKDEKTGKYGLTMVEGLKETKRRPPSKLSSFLNVSSDTWLDGEVDNVARFGAFVWTTLENGDGAVGLVHVSQMREWLESGQKVKVRVQRVDLASHKMSLTMLEEDEHHQEGDSGASPPVQQPVLDGIDSSQWLDGEVTGLAKFGAYVRLEMPGRSTAASGLVHISKLSDGAVNRVEDHVEVGQEVKVRIVNVDKDRDKIGNIDLSMRSLDSVEPDVPAELNEFEGVDPSEWHTGIVAKTTPFGAFVAVAARGSDASAEGLVSAGRMRGGSADGAGGELVEGQEVQVRIIEVDAGEGKLALSMTAEE